MSSVIAREYKISGRKESSRDESEVVKHLKIRRYEYLADGLRLLERRDSPYHRSD